MTATQYEDLEEHVGHNIEIVEYGTDHETVGVATECIDCGVVLQDFENPEVEH